MESIADDRLVGRRATEPASNAVQRLILGPTEAGSQRTERTRLRTTLTELGSDHHTRRNQRARLFEGPDADETTVSYISDGMVIIEHLSARTGDIIRT